jgi:formate hydrogenlyase subunit 6/NADH:ubiquinone oxidoreductase subunit I
MLDRRGFLRLSLGALGGVLFLHALPGCGEERGPRSAHKVTILPSCVACAGCVAACPTGAISLVPGAIAISDQRCIRCGYCVAICPAGGVRVNREDEHA